MHSWTSPALRCETYGVKFTTPYSQPEAYRFSLDSIEFAKWVGQSVASTAQIDHTKLRVLDLCAGCGVIGFELLFHLPEIRQIDFIEIQEVYRDHFAVNLRNVSDSLPRPSRDLRWVEANYTELTGAVAWRGRYDLVLCNPPYFEPQQGRRPPNNFKSRCRFFLDASFRDLLRSIKWITAPGGQAYVLIRDLHDHPHTQHMRRIELGEIWGAQGQAVAQIRGTSIYRYQADLSEAKE
jgi:tRNA1Val (adenine37-N6)-methyltransferase